MAILGIYVRFLGIYVYVRFGSFGSACEPLPTERMIPSKHFPVRRNECLGETGVLEGCQLGDKILADVNTKMQAGLFQRFILNNKNKNIVPK